MIEKITYIERRVLLSIEHDGNAQLHFLRGRIVARGQLAVQPLAVRVEVIAREGACTREHEEYGHKEQKRLGARPHGDGFGTTLGCAGESVAQGKLLIGSETCQGYSSFKFPYFPLYLVFPLLKKYMVTSYKELIKNIVATSLQL